MKIKKIFASLFISLAFFQSVFGQVINTNTTWNTNLTATANVVITNSATLTINCTVLMPPSYKIIVEPGSRLIINSSAVILNSDPYYYWPGIEVWGNSNQPQTYLTNGMPQYQGEVIVNGGTIKNADIGIQAIGTSNGNYDWSKTGGIIKLNSANLLNNKKAIWIGGYHNTFNGHIIPNRSIINNSLFKTYTPDNIGNGMEYFIALYDVDFVRINGNDFFNINPYHILERGTGILAINASYYANSLCTSGTLPCSSYKQNHFKGLLYATRSYGFLSRTFISNSLIEDCMQGIYMSDSRLSVIIDNTILNATCDNLLYNYGILRQPTGIFIDGGNGFKVEENDLSPLSEQIGSMGINVYNTGAVNNELYKNTFADLNTAITSFGQNKGYTGPFSNVGLRFVCNEFEGWYDHYVVGNNGDPSLVWMGIAKDQIYSTPTLGYLPAGEHFSTNYRAFDFDFSNEYGSTVNYYWESGASYKALPTHYSNLHLKEMDTRNTCPSKINNGSRGSTLSQMYGSLSSARISYNSSSTLLNIWMNGGEADLENKVKTIEPWDVYIEYQSLIAKSPYLSEEVIIATIENPSFTSLMIKLLMIANPHASRSGVVMKAIYNRIPALPTSYIEAIESMEDVDSQLDILQANVSADVHLISIISDDIKRAYSSDTINVWAKDSLLAFTSRQNLLLNKYDLAGLYLGYGMYNEMNTTLSNIPTDFELDDQQNDDHNSYISLFTIAQDIYENNKYIGGLDENQVSNLETILALDRPNVSPMALTLLMRNNPNYEYYGHSIELPIGNEARISNPNKQEQVKEQEVFTIYPNPALDFITVEFRSKDITYANVWIVVYDATGKKVLNKTIENTSNDNLVNISELSKGAYTISLFADGRLLESNKLNIIK